MSMDVLRIRLEGAIERLEAGGVRAAFADAVAANVKRAEELGS